MEIKQRFKSEADKRKFLYKMRQKGLEEKQIKKAVVFGYEANGIFNDVILIVGNSYAFGSCYALPHLFKAYFDDVLRLVTKYSEMEN